ncbi:two-component regulator propeller domain-containing protein [Aureibaculum sp. 2210JD6-5]|uniref:hybrid sensor histidine kinase/response regulator transcription factor n=1 Tax=Aureibaculum sp. 2210JD6-5 TaxID=3103957 RepID=UPI002AAD8B41|nr:two-component regulator propeller domain-containing protein [Aureibaculum sp. 2210JD6-5]MDY7397023.1 two-component regulator propeller domain-containing protein [Aureibaculum sp. 2210JD6-5]
MNLKLTTFIFCLFATFGALMAQDNANFKHLSPTLNNSPVNVSGTIQDATGNIWMACSVGILQYDGYDYTLVKNAVLFPQIKQNDRVKTLVKDADKNIWIVSNFGLLSKYNSEGGAYQDVNENLLKNRLITAISSKNNNVWMASNNGTILKYNNNALDSVTTINHNGFAVKNIFDIEVLANNQIYVSTDDGKIFNHNLKNKRTSELVGPFSNFPGILNLTTDNLNRLWIGTETFGLFVYDPSSERFIQNTLFKGNKYNIHNELFITFFKDSEGTIWAGTDGGGLYKINPINGNIDVFTKQDSNEFSLSSNTVLNISEDNHKNIWVATNYGKLNILPHANENIKYLSGSENNTPVRILSIFKSSLNTLWIGTDGFGLTKIEVNEDGTTKKSQYLKKNDLSKGFYVQSITEDNNGNIWFGTYKNGLWIYRPKRDRFEKIGIFSSNKHEATDVRTVFKDSKGRIWVSSNVSLSIYSSELELLASFENNSNGLKGTIAESIIEDKNGRFWLGMFRNNLLEFNENSSNLQFSTFIEHPDLYSVRSMASTTEGTVYLINADGELLSFNSNANDTSNFKNVATHKDRQFVSALLVNKDNIWLGSNNGIHHLNLKTNAIKTYYTADGLQDNVFLVRSAFKDTDGLLYFGGIKGLNYFNPNQLTEKKLNPDLFIHTIEILNKPVESILPDQTTSGVLNTKSLKLKNDQSSFSFKFSAIDNILNPNFTYAYRLKGFDKDWIISHPERVATYTNIPPGNYTFEVKAGTKNGVWDIAPQKIDIKIAPPIWNSTWAYIIYFFILAMIAYSIRRWFVLRKRLFLEKVLHKKENDLYKLKMDFFAKMSHEIQTPLTLISGPIDDMKKRATTDGNLLLKQRLDIIANNADRLSKIARELTLVRNKELDKLQLAVTKNSLCEHLNSIAISFKELARTKHIDFNINCPRNLHNVWYDKEKIEHVLYNLLSNAFKFTPNNGTIDINVKSLESDKFIKLSISDSGPGMPKSELKKVFELFYQSDSQKKYKGTGIGLALTKELINLHNGKISVKSKPKKGTTFRVVLPITEDAYDESDKIVTDIFDEPQLVLKKEDVVEISTDNLNDKTILVVEDNLELQQLLKDLLNKHYTVIFANEGEEGYELAKNKNPDIILSDVMMPKLGGIEMCKKIQQNTLTSHIPIILLTAKNSTSAKIEGLSSGAIEYISKPFNTKELLLKIKNILTSKEQIISNYRKEVLSTPKINIDKTKDELFIENLVKIINDNIDNADFKVEDIAESLNMGYSTLYRKCQTLTGNSLVDFVRLLRLKKAAVLIAKYGYSINETAYLTGFNDPKYFSKCFKSQFKKTPGSFKKEAHKMEIDSFLKNYQLEDIG